MAGCGTAAEPRSAATVLKFSTSKSGGLGDQLPAGVIRVYMKDARGDPQFIGENRISATPMGSQMSIRTGDAFDVKGTAVIVERKRLSSSRWRTTMRYDFTNARPEQVTVDLAQDGLWGDVRLIEQAITGERVSADRMEWKVPVPAERQGVAERGVRHTVLTVRRIALPIMLLAGLPLAGPAAGQAVVQSDRIDLGVGDALPRAGPGRRGHPPGWPGGYALITETRTIRIPAGRSVIRFEGVAEGMMPESAIVTGLPRPANEKNRDARLLSPASLVDAYLKRSVTITRTSRATGKEKTEDAVIQSGPNGGVLLTTEAGVEALSCSGLPESLSYPGVPEGLSAKPTLSVTTDTAKATQATIQLSYLAQGFDWSANYVARVADDGKTLDLFAWLTVANGGSQGFAGASTQAVAGGLHRENAAALPEGPPPELHLQCWPMDITSTYPKWSIERPPPPQMIIDEAVYGEYRPQGIATGQDDGGAPPAFRNAGTGGGTAGDGGAAGGTGRPEALPHSRTGHRRRRSAASRWR